MRWIRAAAVLLLLGAMGCGSPSRSAGPETFLRIAREYVSYGRVDDENRWSPEMCRLAPSSGRFSESRDEATHGRKIYYLFAKDRGAYVYGLKKAQPAGQVLVKEAWTPRPVGEREDYPQVRNDDGGNYEIHASLNGQLYAIGAKAGLYIMHKTVEGWTYGTVTADGTRVLQSGQIPSCLGCHREAKPDSLFGLDHRK